MLLDILFAAFFSFFDLAITLLPITLPIAAALALLIIAFPPAHGDREGTPRLDSAIRIAAVACLIVATIICVHLFFHPSFI